MRNRSDQKYLDIAESLIRLATIAEIHEWDNRKHLERIRNYSFVIASSLALSQDEAIIISLACIVHDVGKIMTPTVLLKRPGNFQPEEWTIIEKHTTQGAKILESDASYFLQTGSTVALTHHERWDGSGYPQHLKKEKIPLSGRICAVADVFDALTSQRLYKSVVGEEEALRLMKKNSGILFDPTVFKSFESNFADIRRIKSTFE